jgi:hypothetical protein
VSRRLIATPRWTTVAGARRRPAPAKAAQSQAGDRISGWFTVLVDKTSLRIYQVRMTATAHFMRDDYGAFNTTPAILPPR